jgi:hypothetical protein
MVQLVPAATLAPQLLANAKEDAFVPVTAMLETVSAALPVLVNVTVCDAVVPPTASLPNDRLVADKDTTGVPTPVPLTAIDCGLLLALSTMLTAAVSAPADSGAKCPWMEQFAPAARVDPQLFAKPNEDAFVPVTVMLVMERAALPVLVIVTDCDALVDPIFTLPKDRLLADKETAGRFGPPTTNV